MKIDTSAVCATSGRLPGVDGLRAFAAMWVVLYHMEVYSREYFLHLQPVDWLLRNGFAGVSLFLVLSGFCLYMPFANGRTDRFRTWQFLWRRCRRLLPAYYVSLVFALALAMVAGRILGTPLTAPELVWQGLSHLTMIYSLFPSTFYALNGAYWSLGLEWQLYLALPILVIGVRRIGLARTVVVAVAGNLAYLIILQLALDRGIVHGTLTEVVLSRNIFGRWSEFLLGMVAAELYRTGRVTAWAARLRWPAIALVPVVLFLNHERYSYLASGFVFFVLLAHVLAGKGWISRLFSWRPVVALGAMSYSLYLVHQPLIVVFAHLLRSLLHTSSAMTFVGLFALLPLIIGIAFVLFMVVERHTLGASGTAPTLQELLPLRFRLRGAIHRV